MSDTFLMITVGVIGIGIGFALGLLVSSLRNPQSESRLKEAPQSRDGGKLQSRINKPASTTLRASEPQPDQMERSQEQTSIKRPSLNPLDAFARALQPSAQAENPFARSIAEQVDEILQEMLEESPLRSKAIRLLELPQKGMVVMIGLEQYQGVEAVPDEEVRSLIRSAAAEWERRVSAETSANT